VPAQSADGPDKYPDGKYLQQFLDFLYRFKTCLRITRPIGEDNPCVDARPKTSGRWWHWQQTTHLTAPGNQGIYDVALAAKSKSTILTGPSP
jgi:hypothetical protein